MYKKELFVYDILRIVAVGVISAWIAQYHELSHKYLLFQFDGLAVWLILVWHMIGRYFVWFVSLLALRFCVRRPWFSQNNKLSYFSFGYSVGDDTYTVISKEVRWKTAIATRLGFGVKWQKWLVSVEVDRARKDEYYASQYYLTK